MRAYRAGHPLDVGCDFLLPVQAARIVIEDTGAFC